MESADEDKMKNCAVNYKEILKTSVTFNVTTYDKLS